MPLVPVSRRPFTALVAICCTARYAVAAEFADRLPAPAAYVVRLRAEFDRKHFVSASSEPLRRAIRAELQRLFGHAARMTQPADAAVQQREATP